MEKYEEFIRSPYSIMELEQFRDESGFIDLTKAGIVFSEESREIVGNPDRVKNWVDFNGQKALIKGETILDKERNYGIYAELIVEEIAKQVGIKTAHYDLIKMLDENGQESYGVLSESVVDTDRGEQLVSLRDMIGDEPVENGDFIDTTSLDFTLDKLEENLQLDGYANEDIDNVVKEYKKRLAFGIAVANTDMHTENIAFITKKVDGKDQIDISPIFDSESALLLDFDYSTVEMLLEDYYGLRDSVNIAHPRIGTIKSGVRGGYDSLWKDTFKELCEDEDVRDFYKDTLQDKVDMDTVLESVEKRIGANLPDNVKLLAKYAFGFREKEAGKIVKDVERTQMEGRYSGSALLRSIIGASLQSTRMGEIREAEKTIKDNIDRDQGKTEIEK